MHPSKFDRYLAALILLIFAIAVSNFVWLSANKIPPLGDGLQDLFPGIKFYLDITKFDLAATDLWHIFSSPSLAKHSLTAFFNYIRETFFIYPPLAPLSYSAFYFFSVPGSGIEVMANMFYLALALFSIYGIGKKMFNQKAGLLAAFIFSSFPGVISISRKIYAEFILMCLVALSLYMLLRTEFFRNKKYSIVLGSALGLTALAKWEFVPALVGPFALVLWELVRIKEKKRWINFLLAVSIGVFICLSWYLLSFRDIIWRLFFWPKENLLSNNPTTFDGRIFSLKMFSFYPLAVINTHIGFFYFLLLSQVFAAFIYKIVRFRTVVIITKEKIFYLAFLVLWFIIPYFVLTIVKINFPSHIMFILPALAVIAAAGVFSFKNKILRMAFIWSILSFGLISHLHSFVDFGDFEPLYKLKLVLNERGRFSASTACLEPRRDCWENDYDGPADTRDWKIKDILSFIKEDTSNPASKKIVLILNVGHHNSAPITSFCFEYYNLLKEYNLFIEPRGNDRTEFPKDRSKFDYVVVNTHGKEIDADILHKVIKTTYNVEPYHKLDELEKDFFEKYSLIKEYVLPDSTFAKIYKLKDI